MIYSLFCLAINEVILKERTLSRHVNFALVLLATVFCSIDSPRAAILDVPGRYPSIQDAINDASSGDTILVAPGHYSLFYQNIVIPGKILLHIRSVEGAQKTIISGKGNGPVVTIGRDSKVSLEGFTITTHGGLDETTMGGAVFCAAGSTPLIRQNIFLANHAVFGGAIYCDTRSMPEIVENVFVKNTAQVSGGGIFTDHARATISRNRFIENSSGSSGGAIGSNRDSSKITNNIFWKNKAVFGSGLSCDRAASMIDNNTFVANLALSSGVIIVEKGSVRLTNLILWQNRGGGLVLRGIGPAGRPVCSDLQGKMFRGINGNISEKPMFVDPQAGDFHLEPGSPCIDKGSHDPFYMDRDGSYNDMGAYGGPQPLIDSNLPTYKGKI